MLGYWWEGWLLVASLWWGEFLVHLIRRAPKATTGTMMLPRALSVFILFLRYNRPGERGATVWLGGSGGWGGPNINLSCRTHGGLLPVWHPAPQCHWVVIVGYRLHIIPIVGNRGHALRITEFNTSPLLLILALLEASMILLATVLEWGGGWMSGIRSSPTVALHTMKSFGVGSDPLIRRHSIGGGVGIVLHGVCVVAARRGRLWAGRAML
jgi:hypothetical protein